MGRIPPAMISNSVSLHLSYLVRAAGEHGAGSDLNLTKLNLQHSGLLLIPSCLPIYVPGTSRYGRRGGSEGKRFPPSLARSFQFIHIQRPCDLNTLRYANTFRYANISIAEAGKGAELNSHTFIFIPTFACTRMCMTANLRTHPPSHFRRVRQFPHRPNYNMLPTP